MSTMRKMAVYLGLVEDDADYLDDDVEYDERTSYAQPRSSYSSSTAPREPRPEQRATTSSSVRTLDPRSGESRPSNIDTRSYSSSTAVAREVVFDNEADPMGAGDAYRITTLHPRSYNDARRIGEEGRETIYLVILIARLVLDYVVIFARDWRPKGAVLVVVEAIYTVTDPPIKALRKVIPPIRIGNISFDLAFLIVLIGVQVLINVVSRF